MATKKQRVARARFIKAVKFCKGRKKAAFRACVRKKLKKKRR